MAERLIIELLIDPSLDKKSSSKLGNAASKAGKKAGKEFDDGFSDGVDSSKKSVISLGKSLKALGGIAAAVGIARVFTEGVQAAIVQEDAINRLNASLKVAGDFTQKASEDFQDYASQLQQVTKFGDELILNNLALAKSFGASNTQAKRILSASTDLAEAFGTDLESATRNVAKTLGGYAGELGEVIPALKDLTQEQLRAGKGIELIAKQFGGTATERLNTFSGATAQLSNTFGDFLEEIGFFITKNEGVIQSIKLATSAFGLLGSQISKVVNLSNAAFSVFASKSTNSLDIVNEKLNGIRTELEDSRKSLKLRKEGIFGITFEADRIAAKKLEARIAFLTEQRKRALVERSKILADRKKQNEDEGRSEKELADKVLFTRDQLLSQLKAIGLTENQIFQQQQDQKFEILRQSLETGLITQEEFNARALQLREQFNERQDEQDRQRALNAEASLSNIGNAWANLAKDTKIRAGEIARIANTVLVNGLGRTFQSIGAAIASGQSALQAFADGVKGIFSDLASSLGDYYIKQGIARLAAGEPGGSAVLSAGIGLKVLSGLLGASGSGASASGASAGGSPSAQTDTATDTGITDDPDEEEIQEQRNIQLVVQGDIFNTEETGRNIIDLLNDNFDNTGASLTNTRFA